MAKINERLLDIYQNIQNCDVCPYMDHEKALRRPEAIDIHADVFIVSQTLAEKQMRKTGVNFFNENGKLGSTGKNLEAFLNLIGRTVYPPTEVTLENGATISKRNTNYTSVYNVEVANCYPGKNKSKKGDRKPSTEEIENCLYQGFLIREIEIIKPKLLILMGKTSRDTFFRFVLHIPYPKILEEHISQVVSSGVLPEHAVGNHVIRVIPLLHASGANPRFRDLMSNGRFITLIREALQ
jgi:uracil-DNA glycosylase